jgi:predicted acyltransferase
MSRSSLSTSTAYRPELTSSPEPAPSTTADPGRVTALDALRGFGMFWIVGGKEVVLALVALLAVALPAARVTWLSNAVDWLSNAVDWGWIKTQMELADWEGFTAWDMIMPLFLFVVGVCMPFAFAKRLQQGQSKFSMYGRILRRVMMLWLLGMIAQGNLLKFDVWLPQVADSLPVKQFDIHPFSNALQAIAVGYLVAGIVLLHFPKIAQIMFAVLLLVTYWLLLLLVPFSGNEAGTIDPEQNLARYVDQLILGRFCDGTTYTWILSGLGFAGTVLLGVFAGHLLRSTWSGIMKVLWLVLLGAALVGLGLLWDGQIDFRYDITLVGSWACPINEHIWSSSMVLYSGGWCCLLLAGFYLVFDVVRLRWLAYPMTIIGINAIFAYMAACTAMATIVPLIPFDSIANIWVGGLAEHLRSFGSPWPEVGEFLVPFTALTILWMVMRYMHRKGTHLRV